MTLTQIRAQAKQYIDQLSPEKLQSASDFLAYLINQESQHSHQALPTENKPVPNALELAGDLVGCVEASEDLSTNKAYFNGFGE